jgi:hypothetical protein
MKAYIISAITLVFLISCTSNDLHPVIIQGSFNTEMVVKERQHVTFNASGDEIKIEAVSIEEARCPEDVQCISAGYVRVSFRITTASQSVIELAIPPNQAPAQSINATYTFSFSGKVYRLILKDVTPYPTLGNPTVQKSVAFVLEAD